MPYKVIIWCSDCTGEDPDGCFGGGTDAIYVDPDDGDPIETMYRAAEIGYLKTREFEHRMPWMD